jgi:hypothetical protein
MKRHSARPATPGDLAGELGEVEKATGWHTWIGVAGSSTPGSFARHHRVSSAQNHQRT